MNWAYVTGFGLYRRGWARPNQKDSTMATRSSPPGIPRSGSLVPALEVKPAAAKGDTDIVGVYQDKSSKPVSPKGPYAQTVDRLRKGEAFAGRHGQVQFLRLGGSGSENGLLIGLGQAAE